MSPLQSFFLCAALSFLTIFEFCIASDTLSPDQTLADGEVLISPSQIFELGFFSPGSSTTRFLGIWYKATPEVVVWVANTQNPITGSLGTLTLSKNGTLILTSAQGEATWSSSTPSMAASAPVAHILDTGNLVVMEDTIYIWQSFDYPGNTRLPGMKMVNNPSLDKHLRSWKSPDDPSEGDFIYRLESHGLSQLSIFKGGEKRYRGNHWNGVQFTGLPLGFYQNLKVDTELSSDGKLTSISEPYNSSCLMRVTVTSAGLLQRHIMNVDRNGWTAAFSEPSNRCYQYGACGPNGICRVYRIPVCECLRGFKPRSQEEWDVLGWTGGCTRNPPLDCRKEDGFLKVERVKFPDTLSFQLNTGMSMDECRDECLNNCSCTAYANPYSGTNSTACLMWFGDLIDVQDFAAGTMAGPSIYIRVPISELEDSRKLLAKIAAVAAAASVGVLALCLCFGVMIFRMRRQRRAYRKKREELKLPLFGLATIAAATQNFSDKNMIGKGGFGPVYKGNLSPEQVVAVKRMSKTSTQGPKEFKNEVTLIAKLQHRNLVRILGCCVEGEEKMLIYEYMHNKSLDYFIFDHSRSALLDWPKRFDIIMGIARGLLYLHHDSRLKVIHRDLKTSNILLDEDLNAKISDFGLARMFEGDQTAATTKRVVGTFGYMSPEYALEGKLSVKSDIFSMGVVILEIVSGRKNTGFRHSCYQNLLEQAWLLWKEGRELELMDACYNSCYVEWQVKRCIHVGLLCVQNAAEERPVMPAVVLMLSSEDTELGEPRKPGFWSHGSSTTPSHNYASRNSITVSEVQGR